MTLPTNQSVEYVIVLEAKQAIAQLGQLTQSADTFDKKIAEVSATVQSMSAKWGLSMQSTASLLKGFDKELSSTGQDSVIFGELGKQGWQEVSNSIKVAENDIGGFAQGVDVARLALGTLVAVGVFQVMQVISNFFNGAIKQARDLELAYYNLANAEKVMSQQGIDIVPQDFENTIDRVKKLFPIFTREEITTGVANLGLFAKELGLTKEQIDQLASSVAVLAVRNNITFGQAEQQIVTGLLSGTTRGIRDLKVEIDDATVKQKGMEMGFRLINGELSEHDKKLAEVALIIENANKEMGNLGDYLDTNDAKLKESSAAWKDFGATVGQYLLPFLAGLAQFGNILLTKVLNPAIDALKQLTALTIASVAGFEAVAKAVAQDGVRSLSQLNAIFKLGYASAFEQAKGLFYVADGADTATKSVDQFADSLKNVQSQNINLDSLINDVQSFADRLSQLDQKFTQTMERDQQDFNTKFSRAQQDYQLEVQRTIQDFNTRRHQLEQSYRDNEKNAEARFQEQLRELREKYLFDLEDALRQRDARQVIRLMEQYKMDKDNLTARFNLENEQRKKQYRQELADLKRQEALKLADMAQAERVKEKRMVEDFNIERARKLQDYQQQKDDLEKSWDEKLQLEAQKLAEQFGLNDDQAKSVYELLKKYYGPKGFIDGLYDYSYKSLVGRSANLLTALQTMIAQFVTLMNSANTLMGGGVIPSGGNVTNTKFRAKGGIDIVDTPTKTGYGATYGEAGPEAHIFLPLGKSIPSVSNLAAGLAGGSGGGKTTIELLLSPDLEARIVGNTLGQTADVILKTLRSKQ